MGVRGYNQACESSILLYIYATHAIIVGLYIGSERRLLAADSEALCHSLVYYALLVGHNIDRFSQIFISPHVLYFT